MRCWNWRLYTRLTWRWKQWREWRGWWWWGRRWGRWRGDQGRKKLASSQEVPDTAQVSVKVSQDVIIVILFVIIIFTIILVVNSSFLTFIFKHNDHHTWSQSWTTPIIIIVYHLSWFIIIYHHLSSFIMITGPTHCQEQISASINTKTSLKLRKNRASFAETFLYLYQPRFLWQGYQMMAWWTVEILPKWCRETWSKLWTILTALTA